jgi:hypothetical protein
VYRNTGVDRGTSDDGLNPSIVSVRVSAVCGNVWELPCRILQAGGRDDVLTIEHNPASVSSDLQR